LAFEGLAGIRPLDPGFRRTEIRPQLADLPDLTLTAFTPLGPIGFAARGSPGAREMEISMPPGCSGELVVVDGETVALPRISAAAGLVRYSLPAGAVTKFRLAKP
jgi:hypothetical protein